MINDSLITEIRAIGAVHIFSLLVIWTDLLVYDKHVLSLSHYYFIYTLLEADFNL